MFTRLNSQASSPVATASMFMQFNLVGAGSGAKGKARHGGS
jgi:hypothetical protein